MSYSIDPISDNCYEGTTCLINKYDIRDEDTLAQLESKITVAKSAELELEAFKDAFNEDDYRAIHRYLFSDLYDWAGEYRTVDISKKGTAFADNEKIPDLMNRCFARLKKVNYFLDLDFNEFIDEIVDLYCTLNHIHPFREGNGRTERVFITQLVRYNGCDINFSDIDTDQLMMATIQSANGVYDFLKDIFYKSIEVPEQGEVIN
jgi:cell filamentation protein